MHSSIGYRRDIDGLRAVAVMSVVLYHLGAPGFGGGFGGVDVFFVISGFLIGSQIAEEIAGGRFSLAGFYERRIRRILPALYAMLALVLLAGAVILFPPDFHKLIPIAVSVVGFLANVRISQALGDYAAASAQASPLLHTWSLAVEEQFYLAFPLVMLAIARLAGRRYVTWLAPLALVSFAASIVAARIDPLRDFYLPTFRAWELLLGALLATRAPSPPRRPAARGAFALAGLVLIAAGDLLLNRDTPFPSEYALAPCAGAVLILYADCGPLSLAGRVLGHPAARWIGLRSYSLYLVHWPLLIFIRDYLDTPHSLVVRALALAASLGLAALSWRFVEQPFRGRGLFSTVQIYALAAGAAVALLGAIFLISRAYDGLHKDAQRFFPPPTPAQRACGNILPEAAARLPLCRVGANAPAQAVLWGDSHAQALIPGVAAAFAAHGQSAMAFTLSGCPPVTNVQVRRRVRASIFDPLRAMVDRRREHCPGQNAAVLRWIADHQIKVAILAGYWIAHADIAKAPDPAANHLTLADVRRPELTNGMVVFERNFAETLDALRRLGVRVYVVEDAPQQDIAVPIALASDARLGRPPHHGVSRAAYDAQQAVVTGIFERLRPRYGFTLLKPQDILCASGECVLQQGGQSLYQDNEHLSPPGALKVVPAFEPIWGPGPGP